MEALTAGSSEDPAIRMRAALAKGCAWVIFGVGAAITGRGEAARATSRALAWS
jgi:hypothetical protein